LTRQQLWALGMTLVLAEFGGCRDRRAATPATPTTPAPQGPVTAPLALPPARSFKVQEDSVAFEGHWVPIGAAPTASVTPGRPPAPLGAGAVHVLCSRAEHWCREDLTQAAAAGAEPAHQTLEYRVEEWTKWGTPASKLLAVRHEGEMAFELRVSLSGLAAEKVVFDKGVETRSRLD
jgi:hypothetical protein